MRFRVLSLIAAVVFCTAPVRADLIINGSFEAPVIGNTTQLSPVTGNQIPGWTVVGTDPNSNVQIFNTNYHESGDINGGHFDITFNAQNGVQSIDVSGAGTGGNILGNGVEQTVATVIGQAYHLSFYVGNVPPSLNADPTVVPTVIDLAIDHGTLQPFTNGNVTPGLFNWKNYTVDFTATTTSTVLDFTYGSSAPPNYVAGLDNVTLNAVPVPSTLMMSSILFGMAGLVWTCKRVRQPAAAA
jgi:hypothetical protein